MLRDKIREKLLLALSEIRTAQLIAEKLENDRLYARLSKLHRVTYKFIDRLDEPPPTAATDTPKETDDFFTKEAEDGR